MVLILMNSAYCIKEGINTRELKHLIEEILDKAIDYMQDDNQLQRVFIILDGDELKLLSHLNNNYDSAFFVYREDLYGVFNNIYRPLIKKKKSIAKKLLIYCLNFLV